jgi:hypothetical protein
VIYGNMIKIIDGNYNQNMGPIHMEHFIHFVMKLMTIQFNEFCNEKVSLQWNFFTPTNL